MREPRICILIPTQDRQFHRANHLRTNSRAGRCGTLNSQDFHCCSLLSSACRLGFSPAEAVRSVTAFLRSPGSCKRFPRSRCWRCSFPSLFGISARTAIAALFLYGLLPIVRNTATGLQDIAQPIRDSAVALGLESGARLRKIYLPIASRSILAGIKTSAVINVGTATLAALIGAGGIRRTDP